MKHSLLSLVVQDEKLTLLLDRLRDSIQNKKNIELSAQDIQYMKDQFQNGISVGEKGLHEVTFELIQHFANLSDSKVTLIVWGRCPNADHPEINKSYTNVDLAQVGSSRYMDSIVAWSYSPLCRICNEKTVTIASYNQYRFTQDYPSGLKLMLTRIKTTSNICYKIADMVFDIDRMFQRDKIINKYTQTLTDIYGVKMAFADLPNVRLAIKYFQNHANIEILAEKDYLGANRKKSGYEAYKVTFKKDDQIIEAQLQTTQMLDFERSSLKASHRTYKEKQMEDRKKLGNDYQRFYELLVDIFSAENDFSKDYRSGSF